MIKIAISGGQQSGRTTRAVQVAKALSDSGLRVAFTYPTTCEAHQASKRLGLQCFSSWQVADGDLADWDAVVADDSERHDPEVLRVIRHRMESYPHKLLVQIKREVAP